MLNTSPKIIIIGAGASGLAAATRLLENNVNDIIVLEAENRIGGRVHSVDFGGSIVDLGGQWCHGEKGNVVYQMVKNLNLLGHAYNNYEDNTYYLSNGTIIDKFISDRLHKIANTILADEDSALQKEGTFGEYFVETYNEIVKKVFKNSKEAEEIAGVMLEWFNKFFLCLESADSWDKMSTSSPYVYKDCEGDPQLHWKDKGFRTILYVMMKKIPEVANQLPIDDKIFLNKEVTRVVWDNNSVNNGGVTVDCADGSSYNADHVIVTVSLGALKNLYSTFSPELPSYKRNAIEAMSIGTVCKILLKFPNKWWNDVKGFSLVWSSEDKKKLLEEFPEGPSVDGRSWLEDVFGFYVIDSHPRVLLGWVVGKMAGDVELLSDDVVTRGCMHLLRKFAGNKYTIPEPDSVLRSKWKNNPHFNGTYTYISMESEKKNACPNHLAQPLVSSSSKQAVLFAGEATHDCYFSTVHGAIETGYREAERILNIYRSPAVKGEHHKVVIIGAGMAGLGAAHTLTEMGCNDILILEAQERPGGRIQTIEWDNHRLELGAQWIHGKLNPLYSLAEKHGLIADETSEEGLGLYIRDNGEIIDQFAVKRVSFEIGKILGECEDFVSSSDFPRSVGEFLENKFQKFLFECSADTNKELYLELFDWHKRFQIIDNSCLNLHRLSAKNWGNFSCVEDKAHINLKCGYDTLVRILVENLPNKHNLRLCTPVTEVNYDKNVIRITCQNGAIINCDHVILTPSLGVLKESFRIIPELPMDIEKSVKDMGYYGIGKIFLIYEKKWWGDAEGFQFIWRRDTALEDEEKWTRFVTGFDPVLGEPNVLLGWIGGEGVRVMEEMHEEEVGMQCTALLRRFVRNRRIPKPLKVVRTKWFSNPWVRGSYCHITPDCDYSTSGIPNLSLPVFVDGKLRILLAGEAVHPSHFSTTHGAFESGQQQARVLCEHITSSKL